jgi:hypothetical protein
MMRVVIAIPKSLRLKEQVKQRIANKPSQAAQNPSSTSEEHRVQTSKHKVSLER